MTSYLTFILICLFLLISVPYLYSQNISEIDTSFITIEDQQPYPGISHDQLSKLIGLHTKRDQAFKKMFIDKDYVLLPQLNYMLRIPKEKYIYFWHLVFYHNVKINNHYRMPDYMYFNKKSGVCIGFIDHYSAGPDAAAYKNGYINPVIGVAIKDRLDRDIATSILHELGHVYFGELINLLDYPDQIKIKEDLFTYLNPESTGDVSYGIRYYKVESKKAAYYQYKSNENAHAYSFALEEIIVNWASTEWGAQHFKLQNPPPYLKGLFSYTYSILSKIDLNGNVPPRHLNIFNIAQKRSYKLAYQNHEERNAY